MTDEILQELKNCIHICTQLELLISQDEETLGECLSGEVYERYTEILWDVREAVTRLKHQIYMLHDEQQAIM